MEIYNLEINDGSKEIISENRSLLSLCDKFYFSNITNLSHMFNNCESLSSLPDIFKWKTNNIYDMIYIFYNCESLSSLPDISKLKTNNVTNMSYMFSIVKHYNLYLIYQNGILIMLLI